MRKTRIQRRRRFISKKFFFFVFLPFCIAAIWVILFFSKNKNEIFYPIPKSLLVKALTSKENGGEADVKKTEQIRLVEDLLKKEHISFSSIQTASASSLLIVLKDQEKIFLSGDKDIALQISSLQRILSRFTIEGKRFGTLDFRFDRPVVSLE